MGCLSSLCLHQRIYGRTMVSTIAATRAMTMTADTVFFCFGLIITINLLHFHVLVLTRLLISYTFSIGLASTDPRCYASQNTSRVRYFLTENLFI